MKPKLPPNAGQMMHQTVRAHLEARKSGSYARRQIMEFIWNAGMKWLAKRVFHFTKGRSQLSSFSGTSMMPTYNPADSWNGHFYGYEAGIKSYADLRRGMIVCFRSPTEANEEMEGSAKRLIGLEGDVVRTRSDCSARYVRLPPGHIWVEGDGGETSLDSNAYGPLPVGLLTGTVRFMVYPWSCAGRIRWWEWDASGKVISDQKLLKKLETTKSIGEHIPDARFRQMLADTRRIQEEARISQIEVWLKSVEDGVKHGLLKWILVTQEDPQARSLLEQWERNGRKVHFEPNGWVTAKLAGYCSPVQIAELDRWQRYADELKLKVEVGHEVVRRPVIVVPRRKPLPVATARPKKA